MGRRCRCSANVYGPTWRRCPICGKPTNHAFATPNTDDSEAKHLEFKRRYEDREVKRLKAIRAMPGPDVQGYVEAREEIEAVHNLERWLQL